MYGTVSYVVGTGYGVDAIASNTLLNLSTNSSLSLTVRLCLSLSLSLSICLSLSFSLSLCLSLSLSACVSHSLCLSSVLLSFFACLSVSVCLSPSLPLPVYSVSLSLSLALALALALSLSCSFCPFLSVSACPSLFFYVCLFVCQIPPSQRGPCPFHESEKCVLREAERNLHRRALPGFPTRCMISGDLRRVPTWTEGPFADFSLCHV